MSLRVPGTQFAFEAGGTVNNFRLVKFGSGDRIAVQADAATDAIIGVADVAATSCATGEKFDVVLEGVFPVTYGGNVTRGQFLTSNSSGQAIPAAPSAGSNVSVIGRALVSGVSGDLGSVLINPGSLQG
jgi:hypothetical protein